MKNILIVFVSIFIYSIQLTGNNSNSHYFNLINYSLSNSSSIKNLVITEIMYNDGGTTDSLEFIEILNNGVDSVSLLGVVLKGRTVSFTFPEKKIKPGGITVVCNNNEAFKKYFKYNTHQWNSGGLNNKQDSLLLISPAGDTLDKVFYHEDGEWPSQADGKGYSLSLCDPSQDNNNGLKWQAASVYAGFKYMGNEIHANPGKYNYCSFDIQYLKQTDDEGSLIFEGALPYIEGQVCGSNFNPNGNQFSVVDHNNEGIWIYSNKKFSYTFHEGDKIAVWGQFENYNSLGQISVDSIVLLKSDTVKIIPKTINKLTEEDEGNLLKIENVKILNFSQWSNSGSGFNVSVYNNIDTFTIRIDKDVDIFNRQAPAGTFNVTGLLGQYDKESPYYDGYQLYPRYLKDINPYNTDNYPLKSIPEITLLDDNGIAKFKSMPYEVRGIVYGINLRPNGLQFTIIDNENNGIGVFSSTKKYGYTVTEGDLIAVRGKLDQYAGLIQMAVDTIILLSKQNSLIEPIIVSQLNENTESKLIKILGLTLKNPSEWKGTGESVNVSVTDGDHDFIMRIDNDCNLSTLQAPDYKFNLTGIGGQFDNSIPYLDGYQIFPRYSQDLEKSSSYNDEIDIIRAFPNPVTSELQIIDPYDIIIKGELTNISGKIVIPFMQNNSFDMSSLNHGIYIAKIVTKQGLRILKVVKN